MNHLSNLLLLAALTSTGLAMAGREGGGGGGICTPKKCLTLAEAGLRINTRLTNNFSIGTAQKKDIETIMNSLPDTIDVDKGIFLRKVMGKSKTFVVVEDGNSVRFENFKKEYAEILQSEGMSSKNFELLAATEKENTYILPGFERLSLRGKSLLLIHEALIREYGASVLQALKFDGELLDFIKLSEEGRGPEFDITELERLAVDLKMGYKFFAKEYTYVTGNANASKLTPPESESQMITDYMYSLAKGNAYFHCVLVTQDQEKCELLEDSLVRRENSVVISLRYHQSDLDKKNILHLGKNRFVYNNEFNHEDQKRQIKEIVIKEAMDKCIIATKTPKLCKLQDKTFEFYNSSYVKRNYKDEYYNGSEDYYSASIIVVQIKE